MRGGIRVTRVQVGDIVDHVLDRGVGRRHGRVLSVDIAGSSMEQCVATVRWRRGEAVATYEEPLVLLTMLVPSRCDLCRRQLNVGLDPQCHCLTGLKERGIP